MGGDRYTRDELLKKLRELSEELGKSPSQKDLEQARGYPSMSPYRSRFESWAEAKREAGLGVHGRGETRYSDEELLEQLRELAEGLGREPLISDVKEADDLPSFQTYIKRFGSWIDAKRKAGVKRGVPHQQRYSDEELLDVLRQLKAELGRKPRVQDLRNRDDYPADNTYRRRFGSWPEAKKKAGVTEQS